jgi:hypothetical protein
VSDMVAFQKDPVRAASYVSRHITGFMWRAGLGVGGHARARQAWVAFPVSTT